MFNKFNKNDIVICISNIENESCGITFDTFMKLGTIKIVNKYDYGVEFEEFVDGHDFYKNGYYSDNKKYKGKNGHCLWIKECNLVPYDKDNMIVYKEYIKLKNELNNNNKRRECNMEKDIKINIDTDEIANKIINNINNKIGVDNMETIYFARKTEEVILPNKDSENAGYDIYAYFKEDELVIKPHETKLIPTGLHSCVSEKYVLLGRERVSTGSIGMKCGAGVIDSGYRGEIFIAITNENDKPLIISKNVTKTIKTEEVILYPYSKGIAQLLLVPVPRSVVKEISVDELKAIPSNRGEGKLGSSNK